ncbi:hypothetical protein [Xylophilus sp.]|uniref:hypothetical protein n=1 Tax=Xylophilus sp. TaxID=2653893 RepID=UPI0013BB008C|nr:hypothetical protein [Xylophilus sp.]KAF1050252.1 MAG: hypothetical protein GAK38_00278 [Xylophilus sp.]
MTLIASDELTDGRHIELPPEAGDVNAPRFEPNDGWLRAAEPAAQKAAIWRWFATRYEEIETTTPSEATGDTLEPQGGTVALDATLRERFAEVVPAEVLDGLIQQAQSRAGNDWTPHRLDKAGS